MAPKVSKALTKYPSEHFYRNETFRANLTNNQQTALNALSNDDKVKNFGPNAVVKAFSGQDEAARTALSEWIRQGHKRAPHRQQMLAAIAGAPNDEQYASFSFADINKERAKEAQINIEAFHKKYPPEHFYSNETFLSNLRPGPRAAFNAFSNDDTVKHFGPDAVVKAFTGQDKAALTALIKWVQDGNTSAHHRRQMLAVVAGATNDKRYASFSFAGINKGKAKEAEGNVKALEVDVLPSVSLKKYPPENFYRNETFWATLGSGRRNALNAFSNDDKVKHFGPDAVVNAFSGQDEAALTALITWVQDGKTSAHYRRQMLAAVAGAPNDKRFASFSFAGIDKGKAKEAELNITELDVSNVFPAASLKNEYSPEHFYRNETFWANLVDGQRNALNAFSGDDKVKHFGPDIVVKAFSGQDEAALKALTEWVQDGKSNAASRRKLLADIVGAPNDDRYAFVTVKRDVPDFSEDERFQKLYKTHKGTFTVRGNPENTNEAIVLNEQGEETGVVLDISSNTDDPMGKLAVKRSPFFSFTEDEKKNAEKAVGNIKALNADVLPAASLERAYSPEHFYRNKTFWQNLGSAPRSALNAFSNDDKVKHFGPDAVVKAFSGQDETALKALTEWVLKLKSTINSRRKLLAEIANAPNDERYAFVTVKRDDPDFSEDERFQELYKNHEGTFTVRGNPENTNEAIVLNKQGEETGVVLDISSNTDDPMGKLAIKRSPFISFSEDYKENAAVAYKQIMRIPLPPKAKKGSKAKKGTVDSVSPGSSAKVDVSDIESSVILGLTESQQYVQDFLKEILSKTQCKHMLQYDDKTPMDNVLADISLTMTNEWRDAAREIVIANSTEDELSPAARVIKQGLLIYDASEKERREGGEQRFDGATPTRPLGPEDYFNKLLEVSKVKSKSEAFQNYLRDFEFTIFEKNLRDYIRDNEDIPQDDKNKAFKSLFKLRKYAKTDRQESGASIQNSPQLPPPPSSYPPESSTAQALGWPFEQLDVWSDTGSSAVAQAAERNRFKTYVERYVNDTTDVSARHGIQSDLTDKNKMSNLASILTDFSQNARALDAIHQVIPMDHESKTANPYLPALEDAIGYSLQTQFRPVQITNDHGGSLTLLFLKDEGSWIPIQEETNVLQLLLSSTPIPIQEVEQQTELFRSSVSMDLNKPTIIARDKVHFTNIDIRNEFIAAALGRNLVGNNDLQWEARFVAHAYDERDTIQLRGRSDLQERSIAPSARSAQGHEDARMGGTTPPPPSELSQMSAPTRPPTGNVHSAAGHARPHSSERGGSKSKRGRFD